MLANVFANVSRQYVVVHTVKATCKIAKHAKHSTHEMVLAFLPILVELNVSHIVLATVIIAAVVVIEGVHSND